MQARDFNGEIGEQRKSALKAAFAASSLVEISRPDMNAENARRLRGFSALFSAVRKYSELVGLHGGACSLLRTRLQVHFPANRENYREYLHF
jgi:hypothetical protein